MTRYSCHPRSTIFLNGADITACIAEVEDASPGEFYIRVYPDDAETFADSFYVEGDVEIIWLGKDGEIEVGKAVMPL